MALWREGLLARAVLAGRTRGYTRHPQLDRFRAARDPRAALDGYLGAVLAESRARGWRFSARKIRPPARPPRLRVTRGQVRFEWRHLLAKLRARDRARWTAQRRIRPALHPSFRLVRGGIAAWERGAVRRPARDL